MYTLRKLICDDLHYCCEWVFFRRFKRTQDLALRLGVSPRTIQRHKAAFHVGELRCEECARCMKKALAP